MRYLLLLWVLSVAAGPSCAIGPGPDGAHKNRIQKKHKRCTSDRDCAVLGRIACCSGCGGYSAPYAAANQTYRSKRLRERQQRCARRKKRCPHYICPRPPRCRAHPKPVCRKGLCAVDSVMKGQCGTGSAVAKCGAQPVADPNRRCAHWQQTLWAECSCRATGGDECDYLRRVACMFYDGKCRVSDAERKRRPGLTRCKINKR